MIKSPDEALDCFTRLIKEKWKDISESDTRSKIIDPIFIECLNWNKNDITREENLKHAGFIDYIFKKGDIPQFLIEAKKEGISFEIPPNHKNRNYKISATISKCKDLIKAIEQAQKYCVEYGIRFAIVTNGYQYVIFEAFKSGSSWRDGKCIVFSSLEDIKSNFGFFFKYLNKNSVSNGTLHTLISEKTEKLNFYRPLDKILNRNAIFPRNNLHQHISPFITTIFSNFSDLSLTEILNECYVYEKAYKETDQGMKQLFYDRIPHYAKDDNIKSLIETEKTAGFFQECVNIVRKNNEKGALVVVLGGIGSGKTTFIHRFFNIILKNEIDNIWFYVDFKTAPLSEYKLEEYVYEKIILNFEEKYLSELKPKLDELKIDFEKEKKDKEEYVSHLFSVLRILGYSVSLVLDNVDRCSINLQERIFVASQHIAEKFLILTLLALREESYIRSKLIGTLDAYHIQKFHIESPKFEKLILQRIDYLLKLLEKENKEIENILKKTINFGDKKDEITAFFKILKASLERKYQHLMQPISLFITCISEGNMRIGLDMFNNFLSSGNTKVKEMMGAYRDTGRYWVQDYQFLKSVILSDSRYYRGNKSYIMNLFDLNTEYTNSHFLNLRVLGYAYGNRSNETIVGRGFVAINRLILEADDLFIPQQAIEDSLRKLAKFNLIKFDNQSKDSLETASYYKCTATGSFYLTKLIKKFIYIDLIHPDTPVCDVNVYKTLKRNIDKLRLDERIARSRIFLNYLEQMEIKEFEEHPEYQNSDLTRYKLMNNIINSFIYETGKILEKPKIKSMLKTCEK